MFGPEPNEVPWWRRDLQAPQRKVPDLTFVPVAGSLMAIAYAILYTAHFAFDRFDYHVLSSRLVCAQPLNNRCVTHWSVMKPAAAMPADLTVYGYQFAAGELDPGNELRKTTIGFTYVVNGQPRTWSYGYEMSLWVAGAAFALLVSYRVRRIAVA